MVELEASLNKITLLEMSKSLNQHDFVQKCLSKYEEEGAYPGDGLIWEKAHYPAPEGLGRETIWLTWEDHQIQGLLQSEEYGRCCFWSKSVDLFLDSTFCENWFYLCELKDKWRTDLSKRTALELHSNKDEQGRSLHTVKVFKKFYTDPSHQSNAGRAAHSEKDEQGRSLHNVRLNEEFGAAKKATLNSVKKSSMAVEVTNISTGEVYWFPSGREACRCLNLHSPNLLRVLNDPKKQTKGHKAKYIEGPNPFY